MRNSLSKGQFYLLTAVVLVGFFFLLSKYINPYAFIDSSKPISDDEIFFFNNVKDTAEKTVSLHYGPVLGIDQKLKSDLDALVERETDLAGEKGYIFLMSHDVRPNRVNFLMALVSDKYILNSTFSVVRP